MFAEPARLTPVSNTRPRVPLLTVSVMSNTTLAPPSVTVAFPLTGLSSKTWP